MPLRKENTVRKEESVTIKFPKKSLDKGPYKEPLYKRTQFIGLLLGPSLFVLTLLFFSPVGLSFEGTAVLATTLWVATWWITEAIPIPVASLLPILLFPLTGALDTNTVTSAYGDSIIFLFLGGFLIALAMEKWNLHKRIAVTIIILVGTSTNRLILGFMVATGFLSMWISNTAAAMMMVPIGSAIIKQASEAKDPRIGKIDYEENFSKSIMLGIGFSASIGGAGTLIGTPPNMILAGVVNQLYGVQISFGAWMVFAIPIVIVLMASTWLYLIKVAFPVKMKELPGGKELISKQKSELGKITYEEKMVLGVFLFAAFMWITSSLIWQNFIPGLNDTMIALVAAGSLFLIPSLSKRGSFLLDWSSTKQLPWGILLLFGGGLAIAAGFRDSGLAVWMGEQLTVLDGVSVIVVILIVTIFVKFLTEITSNTATATMIIPIMAALAAAVGIHPYALMFAATLSASCAFMLPVATPPNAVVFASGYIKITDMARSGFWVNIISIALIVMAVYFYLPLVWGLDLMSTL
ncbi:DASS family sodium-coupled anion symporter [Bacillaceae bacterium IKA-2]|nr:DASS family sodium-coupled anion symporter [Bacillaceae bacterium IKA-2]